MRQFQPVEKADIVEFRVKLINGVRWTYKDPSSASHCCCQQVVLGDNGSSMRQGKIQRTIEFAWMAREPLPGIAVQILQPPVANGSQRRDHQGIKLRGNS